MNIRAVLTAMTISNNRIGFPDRLPESALLSTISREAPMEEKVAA